MMEDCKSVGGGGVQGTGGQPAPWGKTEETIKQNKMPVSSFLMFRLNHLTDAKALKLMNYFPL